METLQQLAVFVQQTFGLPPHLQEKIIATLGVTFALFLIYKLVLELGLKKLDDPKKIYTWQKIATYTAFFFGVVLIGRIWFQGVQSLATFFGLLSAGLAIALKDPITNLAGWTFLLWRKPFVIGDRIQIGSNVGDVIAQGIFTFTLMEVGNWVNADNSTGRIILIPNGRVFTETVANYSKGFDYIWNEVPVLVTFESNWEKARQIVEEVGLEHAVDLSAAAEKKIKQAARRIMVYYSKLTPFVFVSTKEGVGIYLTLRYLCEPRKRRNSEHYIWSDILARFAQCDDIQMGYPTWRTAPGSGPGNATPAAAASKG